MRLFKPALHPGHNTGANLVNGPGLIPIETILKEDVPPDFEKIGKARVKENTFLTVVAVYENQAERYIPILDRLMAVHLH